MITNVHFVFKGKSYNPKILLLVVLSLITKEISKKTLRIQQLYS